jgi:hypothetical protein
VDDAISADSIVADDSIIPVVVAAEKEEDDAAAINDDKADDDTAVEDVVEVVADDIPFFCFFRGDATLLFFGDLALTLRDGLDPVQHTLIVRYM